MRRAASTCEVCPINLRRVLPLWAARGGWGDWSGWERREDAEVGTGGTTISIMVPLPPILDLGTTTQLGENTNLSCSCAVKLVIEGPGGTFLWGDCTNCPMLLTVSVI